MTKLLTALALTTMLSPVAAWAQDQDLSPSVVFDMGGKFDRSFNEGIYNGIEKFKEETGISYMEFEVTNETQREQALRRMAREGSTSVIAVGFAQAPAVEAVAADYPDVKFTIIDAVVEAPNVRSVVFQEHEGGFLVGMIAALTTKTDTIGFVGGMDIPLIRNFECGYEQGAKYVNPDITVLQNMTGTTPAAWNDPGRGAELAQSQFDRDADIVYAAAGATGLGVLQAASDAGKYSIGVDSNQNYLFPGSVLTSMMKRVDVAAYTALKESQEGTWTPGVQTLGLAQEGVGYAIDENNESLIPQSVRDAVEAARAKIISGELTVHDYRSDNSCTYDVSQMPGAGEATTTAQ